jgi:CBS domain-containing protein
MTTQPNPSSREILQAVRLHPFFQGVEESTALSLLESCHYYQFEKGVKILHAHTARTGLMFMLEGTVEVLIKNETSEHEEVLEIIQRGELIGLSSIADFLGVSKVQEAAVEVRALTPVAVLEIPFDVIIKRWDDPNVHDYLLAQISIRLKDVYTSLAEQIKLSTPFFEKKVVLTRVQDLMKEQVVTVQVEQTIMKAAKLMSAKKVSSVVVTENGKLVGILTERDVVSRVVAAGLSPAETCLNEIMTENPLTIDPLAYYYDALSSMLLHSVKHLPVVKEDGLVGMITLTDLLRKKNESYIKTIRSIEKAEESELPRIKEAIYDIVETLLKDRVPSLTLLNTVTVLYDRLVIRSVELAQAKLAKKPIKPFAPFALYQMGSAGRAEQFILTDQDHFLVYEDERDEEYYAQLGSELTKLLEQAGYRRCIGLMMASEKQWRGTIAKWEERLRGWLVQSSNESLLLAQNFFSYRFLTGDFHVHQRFEQCIGNGLSRSKIFLYRLTQLEREHVIPSLESPIRSLLKRERKPLDMKKDILFPFHHSLQILSLLNGHPSGTPLQRVSKLVERGVLSEEFSQELESALEHILSIYIHLRWESSEATTLAIARLTTKEKQNLSSSLKTLRELQSLVFAHFAQ